MKKRFLISGLMLLMAISAPLQTYAVGSGAITVTYEPTASETVIDKEPGNRVDTGSAQETNQYTKWIVTSLGAIIAMIVIKRKREDSEEIHS